MSAKVLPPIRILLMISAVIALGMGSCTPAEPIEPGTEPTGAPATTVPTTTPMAVIEGQVSFGPLQPVIQKDEPTPVTPPELFEGRFVQILLRDGETMVSQTPVGTDGRYRIEIPAGDYIVNFTLLGIELSTDVPAEVSLRPGDVLTLDIAVDTGIR